LNDGAAEGSVAVARDVTERIERERAAAGADAPRVLKQDARA
jgi:hypothetical protein